MRSKGTYQSKANRDRVARAMAAAGCRPYRRSVRGAVLHPMYVTDWAGPEAQDTGCGNVVYRTLHAVLYIAECRCESAAHSAR